MSFLSEVGNGLSVMLGFNVDQSINLAYQLIIIFIFTWLAISGYLLSNKPKMLEKWKYPTFSLITIVFLISVLAYAFTYLTLLAFSMLFVFESGIREPSPFFINVLFMILFIIILFQYSKKFKVGEDTQTIPKEFINFIPISSNFIFSLVFINLSLFFLHNTIESGALPSILSVNPIRKWIATIGFILVTLFLIWVTNVNPKKKNKFINNFKKWVKKHKLLFIVILILLLILIFLTNKIFPS